MRGAFGGHRKSGGKLPRYKVREKDAWIPFLANFIRQRF